VAACRAPRPDVIFVMTDPPVAGVIALAASRWHRRPFVQWCHDLYPEIAVALGVVRKRTLVTAWTRINSLVRNRAARLIVVGRDMQEKLEQEGWAPEKLVFVPTWAVVPAHPETPPSEVRTDQGWDERFVVMHAGNMGLAQNVDVFVAVAERLRTEASEVLLVFLGDGPARPALEREVDRRGLTNVQFLAQRPKTEAEPLMAAADIHVISLVPGLWGCAAPSKTYGVMAVGRPFIAAVDPGAEPARIADEFGCGRAVPAGDPGALAEAILRMRSAPLEEMAARAEQGFRTRYERSCGTEATRRVLETVAGERRS
jgi:colanic acid biosynthesis glycosyl transferase WcaI